MCVLAVLRLIWNIVAEGDAVLGLNIYIYIIKEVGKNRMT
jgi:hypothetical protein